MALYVNLRAHAVGGPVVDPYVLHGDPLASPAALRVVGWAEIGPLVTGKDVLLGTHGFNVSYQDGARSLGQLEPALGLRVSDVYFGVLWPGDSWLPFVNYPFEGDVSMDCGRRLAAFCDAWLAGAQSVSFVSHSLGARLVLEAVKHLSRPARVVCVTAAAINRDCLQAEYAAAAANASNISVLSSRADTVLRLAFPLGDPISDLLHPDHAPFQRALGYEGPPPPASPPIRSPWQIADQLQYRHGDYLPPSTAVPPGPAKWHSPAGFMGRAFREQPQTWP